jgi:hypothetical protein
VGSISYPTLEDTYPLHYGLFNVAGQIERRRQVSRGT